MLIADILLSVVLVLLIVAIALLVLLIYIQTAPTVEEPKEQRVKLSVQFKGKGWDNNA